MEAAARVADRMLQVREADYRAAEAAMAKVELARRQEDDELDALIASGEVDVGDEEHLNLSGLEPPTHPDSQVDEDQVGDELARLFGDAVFYSSESDGDGQAPSLHPSGDLPPVAGPMSQEDQPQGQGGPLSALHRRARSKKKLRQRYKARAKRRAEQGGDA